MAKPIGCGYCILIARSTSVFIQFYLNTMSLYEPTRGGNRGGKDQFAWEDVKSDKYRENYLGRFLIMCTCTCMINL